MYHTQFRCSEPVDGTGDVVTGHALLAHGHGVMAVHG